MSEYFRTVLGPIPEDWEATTIGDLAIHVGSGITPTGGSEVYTDSGVMFIRSQNVTNDGLLLDDVAFINQKTHERMKGSEVFPFDVLLNITGASIGRCCFLPLGLGSTNVNQHVCAIRLPAPSLADAKYLSSIVASPIGENQIFRLNAGGNREGLNYQQLRKFRIPWAPKAIRARIARILTTLDNLIEKTENLIAKYQAIKQGMMHDLFTRGIDSNGHLRPPQSEAPELYKQAELGWIPKEWEEGTLGSVCRWMSGGTPSKSNHDFWIGSVPWFSPKDMKSFELVDSEDHISEEASHCGTRVVDAGTVLIVIRGMILAHSFPVGITTRTATFNQDVKALTCDGPVIGRFLAYWLTAHAQDMVNLATESTHGTKRFDMDDLYGVTLGVPHKEEQAQIVRVLDRLDGNCKVEQARRSNLLQTKSGLMQDLLTGKVQVTVDEEEANV